MKMTFIHVGVIDVIDILLVALLMYQVYNLLKGTIATYIFVTVITFYVIWLLVRDKMLLLGGILGQIIGVGAIALVVVFQQELRRFLITFSSRYLPRVGISIDNLFYRAGTELPAMNVNAIIKTCVNLSRDRVGGLIVLQRKTSLETFGNTGEIIDARITSRLLESIFMKNSPLHDGAVIIHNDRILAAACILPLSDNFLLPHHLGLRHRAAVGLTEQTDALVIVISEENGEISLAEAGKLNKINVEGLHQRLEAEFIKTRERKGMFTAATGP